MASRGRGAHRKGEAFERKVAKMLSLCLSLPLERVKDGEQSDRVHYPGDIKRSDGGTMPLVVECKAQKFSLDDVLGGAASLRHWFEQLARDRKASGIKRGVVAANLRGKVAFIARKADAGPPYYELDTRAVLETHDYLVYVWEERGRCANSR